MSPGPWTPDSGPLKRQPAFEITLFPSGCHQTFTAVQWKQVTEGVFALSFGPGRACCRFKEQPGPWEMAHGKAFPALMENLGLIPSTHIRCLTINYNSSCRGSALHTHPQTHKENFKNKENLWSNFSWFQSEQKFLLKRNRNLSRLITAGPWVNDIYLTSFNVCSCLTLQWSVNLLWTNLQL